MSPTHVHCLKPLRRSLSLLFRSTLYWTILFYFMLDSPGLFFSILDYSFLPSLTFHSTFPFFLLRFPSLPPLWIDGTKWFDMTWHDMTGHDSVFCNISLRLLLVPSHTYNPLPSLPFLPFPDIVYCIHSPLHLHLPPPLLLQRAAEWREGQLEEKVVCGASNFSLRLNHLLTD